MELAWGVQLQLVPWVGGPGLSVVGAASRGGGSPLASQLLLVSPAGLDPLQAEGEGGVCLDTEVDGGGLLKLRHDHGKLPDSLSLVQDDLGQVVRGVDPDALLEGRRNP